MINRLKNFLFDACGVFMLAGFVISLYVLFDDVAHESFVRFYMPTSFFLIMFLSVHVSRLERRIRELERRELEQTIEGIRKS